MRSLRNFRVNLYRRTSPSGQRRAPAVGGAQGNEGRGGQQEKWKQTRPREWAERGAIGVEGKSPWTKVGRRRPSGQQGTRPTGKWVVSMLLVPPTTAAAG